MYIEVKIMNYKEANEYRQGYIDRMSNFYKAIKSGNFDEKDFDALVKDLADNHDVVKDGYCDILKRNVFTAIRFSDYLQDIFAKKFDCKKEEIDFYKVTFLKKQENNKYKIALGSLDATLSTADNIGNLEVVLGNAHFKASSIKSIKGLKKIGGFANFGGSKIRSLDTLEEIGGGANFWLSETEDFGALKKIGGNVYLPGKQLKSLGALEYVGGNMYFERETLVEAKNLKYVGGELSNISKEQAELLRDRIVVNDGKVFFDNSIFAQEENEI